MNKPTDAWFTLKVGSLSTVVNGELAETVEEIVFAKQARVTFFSGVNDQVRQGLHLVLDKVIDQYLLLESRKDGKSG